LACGMMLTCRLTASVFVLPFALWILVRSPRRALVVTALGLLAYSPWAWLYHSIYGSIMGPSAPMLHADNWTENFLPGLAGVLISPGRGLLIYQPWVLLGLTLGMTGIGGQVGKQVDAPAGWRSFCFAVIGLHIALIAAWGVWWGGHCWGSRLLADIMPLL